MQKNKIIVPVDAEIRRYYRLYIEVEPDTPIQNMKAIARQKIQDMTLDELRKTESLELPDVEESDVLALSIDLDGIQGDY